MQTECVVDGGFGGGHRLRVAGVSLALAASVALLTGGCAQPGVPDAGGAPAAATTARPPETAADGRGAAVEPTPPRPPAKPTPPRVANRTGYPFITLVGVDQFGEYTSLGLKVTYAIDQHGALHALTSELEPMLGGDDAQSEDYDCKAYGGGFNQRTTWFPDTGVFVVGARVTALHDEHGKKRLLLPLAVGDHGIMAVSGPKARELEYGYVPCVGTQRARHGWRTLGYLEAGDRLSLRPDRGGRALVLSLPREPRPYVWMHFADRDAQALVPARPVVVTIDWPKRRVVVQYQATVAMTPQVARATWYLTEEGGGQGSPREAFIAKHLRGCPATTRPMDPCANPHHEFPPTLQEQP